MRRRGAAIRIRATARWLGACALLTIALVAVVGCGSGGSGSGSLNGTSWRLVGWSLSSLDPSSFAITARFADGQISGTSAVNQYGGAYSTTDDGGFSAGSLAQTEMAGPQDAMRAEAAYMELLTAARSYKVEGDTLTLFDGQGNESLIFERADK